MAERIVSWKAIADFAAVSREAKKSQTALESLRRTQERINRESAASGRSGPAQQAATRNMEQLATATDRTAQASTRNASAQQRQVAALRGTERASKSAAGGMEQVVSSTRRVAEAHQAAARSTTAHRDASHQLGRTSRTTAAGLREVDSAARSTARSVGDLGTTSRRANTELGGLNRQLGGLHRNFSRGAHGAGILKIALAGIGIPAIVSGIAALVPMVSALGAGFVGLAGAIAPAAGLIGTLPGLLAAAGGGIGTLMLGFAGIGGALKAYGQQQKAASRGAAQQATAQKQLASAYQSASDTARASARAIAAAEQGVADAQRRSAAAQQAVTQARKEAREQVEDLRTSLRSLALQEEGAVLGLEEARLRLKETMTNPSTDLERRQAKLAVKEAQFSLEQVRKERDENKANLKDAQRKGIEGSQQVIAAKRDEFEASRSLQEAEVSLAEARREGARAAQESATKIADAQAGAAKQTDVFAESLKKLTPEAQAVVRQLLAMQPLLDKLRATAQRGLMPGVLSLLRDVTKLFPTLNTFVGRAAESFGDFFERVGDGLTSPTGMRGLRKLLDSTNRVMDYGLDAAYNLGVTLGNIAVAAAPLTEWLAETVEGWTDTWRAMTSGEAGQRRLTDFFTQAQDTASTLGRILGNLAGALYGVGTATADLGRDGLAAFEDLTQRWEEFTNSVEGQNQIKAWADEARPVLKELGALLTALLTGIMAIGQNIDVAGLVRQLREDLLPVVLDVIEAFGTNLVEHLVDFATNIGKVVAALASTGILDSFAAALVTVSEALAAIAGNKAGATVLVAVGTALLALVGVTKVAAGVRALSGAFTLLTAAARRAWVALGPVGIAIAVVSAAAGHFITAYQESKDRVEDLTRALRENNGVLDESARKSSIDKLQKEGSFDAAKDLGVSIETLTRAYFGEKDALTQVNAAIDAARQAEDDGTGASIRRKQAAEQVAGALARGTTEMGKATEAAGALAAADKAATTEVHDLAWAEEEVRKEHDQVTTALDAVTEAQDAYTDAVNKARTAVLTLRGDMRAYEAALDDAREALKENGRTLDIHTEAGRANQEALDQLAESAVAVAEGMRDAGKTEDEVASTLKKNKQTWIDQAVDMGMNEEKAKDLADQLFKIPEKVETKTEVVGTKEFKEAVQAAKEEIEKLPPEAQSYIGAVDNTEEGLKTAREKLTEWGEMSVSAKAKVKLEFEAQKLLDEAQRAIDNSRTAAFNRAKRGAPGNSSSGFASGGEVRGPGTTTSDSIPALLSNKEFVQSASATQYYGTGFMHALNQRRISRKSLPGFKRGGPARLAAGGQATSGAGGQVLIQAGVALDTAALRSAIARVMDRFARFGRWFTDQARALVIRVKTEWDKFKQNLPAPIQGALDKFEVLWAAITTGFRDMVDGIEGALAPLGKIVSTAFDKIKKAASDPIGAMVKIVNSGLIEPYLKLAKALGISTTVKPIVWSGSGSNNSRNAQNVGRAEGGPIRGRGGPRQDNIAGIDRRTGGQTSWVSSGEYVVNARAYRRHKRLVEQINASGLHGPLYPRRRAYGGPVGLFLGGVAPTDASSVTKHGGYSWARWAGDLNDPGGADYGDPVRAWKAGQVSSTARWPISYGHHIRINHGKERSLYAHLSKILVRAGQNVAAGQHIGNVGSTGNSSGPHLHFEIAGGSGALSGAVGSAISAGQSLWDKINPAAVLSKAMGAISGKVNALKGTMFGDLAAAIPAKIKAGMLAFLTKHAGAAMDEGTGVTGSWAGGSGPGGLDAGQMNIASIIARVGAGMGRKAQLPAHPQASLLRRARERGSECHPPHRSRKSRRCWGDSPPPACAPRARTAPAGQGGS